jgi:hypothetical protein
MRFRGVFGLLTGLFLLAASSAGAATIEVETDGDEFGAGGPCALREAIEAARTNHAFGGCPKGSKTKRDTVKLVGDAALTIAGESATNADGDLDYDKGGRLTILGGKVPHPDPPAITQNFSDRILEITREKGVKIQGVQMLGGGDVDSGGAVRASQGAAVTLETVSLHDNISELRGGAVACEGCKSLRLQGAFNIDDNLVQSATSASGGAVWSNAPTVIDGVGGGLAGFDNARMTQNTADPGGADLGRGGAIFAGDDLTITNTRLADNEALGIGSGGAIALEGPPGEKPRLELRGTTLDGNVAEGRGGALDAFGMNGVVDVRRSAIVGNLANGTPASADTASGGGVFTSAKSTFVDTVIAENEVSGDTVSRGGGIAMSSGNDSDPQQLTLVRTSVTQNVLVQGAIQQAGGGIYAQGDLTAVNSTISANSAAAAGGNGGGVHVSGTGLDVTNGSARLLFSTLKGNLAGGDGNGIRTTGPPVSLRGSILDHTSDSCAVGTSGEFSSAGFNVEETNDPDCGLDAPTDAHAAGFLTALSANGSQPVGQPTSFPGGGIKPLTNSFTNNTSAALDLVPAAKCKVDGKALKGDARGARRPAEDGCDAGAIERTSCLGAFAVGTGAFIGTKRADQAIVGATVVLSYGGDDFLSTGPGDDSVCAGKGNDIVQPGADDDAIAAGPGTDWLNYNNAMPAGILINLATAIATGSTIGNDTFSGIENAQGSEDDDEILGDGKRNRLIGGGGDDTIRARGGIDVIDARAPGDDPDVEINCGPGDNSKEKALVDPEDPAPISC